MILHRFISFSPVRLAAGLLWIGLSVAPGMTPAQQDTLFLPAVDVTAMASKWRFPGCSVTAMDSLSAVDFSTASLSGFAASENIPVKSYGSGGSATISIRGTEARHASVVWNGFNINTPSLGLCDLSLAPVSFADDIRLVQGSTNSFSGSAIGGLISMDYRPAPEQGLAASMLAESGDFGYFHVRPSLDVSGKKFASSTRMFAEQSRNNFLFINTTLPGSPEKNQPHAFVRNAGVAQYFNLTLPRSVSLTSGIWYQVMRREIPPLMNVPVSRAMQEDSLLRCFLAGKKHFRNAALDVRAAFFDERQHYSDPAYRIDARYNNTSYKAQGEYTRQLTSRLVARAAAFYDYYRPRIEEYNMRIGHDHLALLLEANFRTGVSNAITAGLRREWRTGQTGPVSPSVGLEQSFWQNRIRLLASAGRYFHFPGLNDLYWQPGGNQSLLPESAWTIQACTVFRPPFPGNPEWEQAFYAMRVSDWIQWQPTAQGYYAPVNLSEVYARGIDESIRCRIRGRHVQLVAELKYGFCLSTLEKTGTVPDTDLAGKQLVFIPQHRGAARLTAAYRRLSLSAHGRYTGERYTTADNRSAMPAFTVLDATLRYAFSRGDLLFEPSLSVRNAADTEYQVIPFRPEPGLHVKYGLLISYRHKRKTS